MNFDGSNIFKTLESPRKNVHGVQLALGPSFMTPSLMLCVPLMSKVGCSHDSNPWRRGQAFGDNLVIIPLLSPLRAQAMEPRG